MNYTLSNTIDKPLEEVIAKLKEPEGVKHWMEGLQKIEHLSGTPGEVGAKSDFYFLYKKKEMKVSETILEQNLPNQIKYSYQSPMGTNIVELLFESLSDNRVKQTSNTSMEVKGFMKLMAPLFKGMFKKQSLTYMTAFKDYVEK